MGLMDVMGFRDDSDVQGLNASAMPQNAMPAAAPTVQAAPAMSQAPQRGFGNAFLAGAVSPSYADSVFRSKMDDYRNKVVGGVVKSLLGGRDPNTPMTWQDVQQATSGIDPSLMGNKRFLAGMGYIMQDWNGRIAGRTQNQFATGRMYGAEINDPTTMQNFQRFGYMTPGQGQAQGAQRQNQGGLMDLAPGGAPVMPGGWNMPGSATRAFTMPKQSTKAQAFPGAVKQAPNNQNSLTIPRDADLKFRDDMRTRQGQNAVDLQAQRIGMPLAVQEARLKARAGQEEQTSGHKARRGFDQANPPGKYYTYTDPKSGEQYEQWSGGDDSVYLGAKAPGMGQIKADLVRRGIQAARDGKSPDQVFNTEELQLYQNAMKSQASMEDLIQLLFAGQGAGPGQAVNPRDREVLRKYPNAQKDADGNWYVNQDGKRYRIED